MLTVGTILREPVETVMRFVAWYLAQGADRIVLCFDDPLDPAIPVIERVDRVDCIACSPAFWKSVNIDPQTRFTRRQNRAMAHVYRGLSDGWFLNVDSDELLYFHGRTIAEEIATQPDDIRAVRVLPVEHVQTPDHPGRMIFRQPMPRYMMRNLYGDYAKAMQPRLGLSGHTVGKSLTRAGLKRINMRQHFLQRPDGEEVCDRILGPSDGAYLMHFFDQGYDIWRDKLPWRLSSNGFRQPMRDVIEPILASADPEPALRELYDALHVFDAEKVEMLGGGNLMFELDGPFKSLFQNPASHPAFRALGGNDTAKIDPATSHS